MSIKSKGRQLGRMVRRVTGLPFPICMKIGKMVAQSKGYDLVEKFPQHITREVGCECCGPEMVLSGPKGSIESLIYLTEGAIEREFRITEAMKKVPVGTPVTIPKEIAAM